MQNKVNLNSKYLSQQNAVKCKYLLFRDYLNHLFIAFIYWNQKLFAWFYIVLNPVWICIIGHLRIPVAEKKNFTWLDTLTLT